MRVVPVQDHRKLMAGSCTISYVCVLFKSNNSSHKKMQNTHYVVQWLNKNYSIRNLYQRQRDNILCNKFVKANHQILIIFIDHVHFSQAWNTKTWICNSKTVFFMISDCLNFLAQNLHQYWRITNVSQNNWMDLSMSVIMAWKLK